MIRWTFLLQATIMVSDIAKRIAAIEVDFIEIKEIRDKFFKNLRSSVHCRHKSFVTHNSAFLLQQCFLGLNFKKKVTYPQVYLSY